MDRAMYHFQILADTAVDLSGLRHPHRIVEAFLLSAQGGVGARGGFAAVVGEQVEDFHLVTTPKNREVCLPPAEVLFVTARKLAAERRTPFLTPVLPDCPCTPPCAVMLVCPLGEARYGLLGLEANLHDSDYDEEDRQLLAGLALLFQTSLRFALFATRVEMLNAELEKRNEILDRQIFHLNALRDLSREFARADLGEVAEHLLLTVLGHFARPQGLILLHDRATGALTVSARGDTATPQFSTTEVDRLFFLCLAGVSNKHMRPLQVEPVETLTALAELPLGFPPRRAFLFMLRIQFYGVILLGPGLEAAKVGDDDLLHTFVSHAVLLLKNTESFATIQALNADLTVQNETLRLTVEELTKARDQISVLETARRRIVGIVHRRSAERIRIRWVDFALIIGLSIGLALVFNQQSPWGIPLVTQDAPAIPTIAPHEAKTLVQNGDAILVDARPREFFERGHAEGAINIPAQLFDLVYMMQMAAEAPGRPIVVYGRSVSRRYDAIVAHKFLNRDHERVLIVDGDMPLTSRAETP